MESEPEEIRRIVAEMARLKRQLDELRAQMRRVRGRQIIERNDQGEPVGAIADDLGMTRQYAHKLMREARDGQNEANGLDGGGARE